MNNPDIDCEWPLPHVSLSAIVQLTHSISLVALSPYFWQYAVIKQKAIDDKKLTWVATHRVTCSAVPPGEQLKDQIYAAGQKSSPAFSSILTAMSNCVGPYDWDTAVKDATGN